jgi:hypothetical protein
METSNREISLISLERDYSCWVQSSRSCFECSPVKMNTVLLLLILFGRNAARVKRKCHGNHTFADSAGECACRDGFPLGDPDSRLGCFNCQNLCSTNSTCVRMDVCECRPGFSRIQNGNCMPIFPLPVLITPQSGSYKGGYNINITIESETDSKTVFCRFPDHIVPGFLNSRSTIGCIVPPGAVGRIEIRVSSDANDWSLPGIGFQYVTGRFDRMGRYALPCLAIVAVVGIVRLTISALRNPQPDQLVQEMQPLQPRIPRAHDS